MKIDIEIAIYLVGVCLSYICQIEMHKWLDCS